MNTLLKICSLLLFSSSFAHAAEIGGTYKNPQPCSFGNDAFLGTVTIPAGKLVVTENIPYSSDFIDEATPSILFQSNGITQPVTVLRIGRHQHFAYGSSAYSMGTYVQEGLFRETYFDKYGDPAIGDIVVEATDRSLVFTVTSSAMSQPVTCTFNR